MTYGKVTKPTLLIYSYAQISLHRDPNSPIPAALFGPGVHLWNNDEERWGETCNGGHLMVLNGAIDVPNGPLDATFIDGNEPHGPMPLRALDGMGDDSNHSNLSACP